MGDEWSVGALSIVTLRYSPFIAMNGQCRSFISRVLPMSGQCRNFNSRVLSMSGQCRSFISCVLPMSGQCRSFVSRVLPTIALQVLPFLVSYAMVYELCH